MLITCIVSFNILYPLRLALFFVLLFVSILVVILITVTGFRAVLLELCQQTMPKYCASKFSNLLLVFCLGTFNLSFVLSSIKISYLHLEWLWLLPVCSGFGFCTSHGFQTVFGSFDQL